MKSIMCFGIAMLTLVSFGVRADKLKVGDKAPDFSLKGSDGKTYSLSDYKGKQAVVLAWFPKAFTSGCTKECKSIHEAAEKLKPLGVAYFTASVDKPEQNKKFAESLQTDYPILSDPSKETAKEYGVVHGNRQVAERWTFYIDKEGIIRGIDKGVQKRTEQAGEDIVKKVKELGLAAKE